MIQDKRYLEVLQAHANEILMLVSHFNARSSGMEDKEQLVRLRLQMNEELEELLHKHRRAMCHMIGLPVEPEVHFAECKLEGEFGGGAAI